MAGSLPISALLSQAFVAFTIEGDNEFERQVPHRTAARRSSASRREVPWLTSMAMWFTCLRYVDDAGRSVHEVDGLARTQTNWNGMERWGYIDVAPDPADPRPRPPRRDWVVRATPGGRRAQAAWAPLSDVIEARWQERFGNEAVGRLRERLTAVAARLDPELPDCLPILGFGLYSRLPERRPALDAAVVAGSTGVPAGRIALPSLMAKVLLSIALAFEERWPVSLATSANVLRVLDEVGQPVAGLPRRSGVSKEALAMAFGVLTKAGLVEIGPSRAERRGKAARLTELGTAARFANEARLAAVEASVRERVGGGAFDALRTTLEAIVEPDVAPSPLFLGLAPDPDSWRAAVPAPVVLPH